MDDKADVEIHLYGDPVLRCTARHVEAIDGEVRRLADGMVRALTLKEGYGLAAPQVGALVRLIVVDVEDLHVVVNPRITWRSEEEVLGTEGCLSLPGVEAEIPRARAVRVEGLTLEGEPFTREAEDLEARVFQHEVDHLDGVLFIDYLGAAKRTQLLKEYGRKLKEYGRKLKEQAEGRKGREKEKEREEGVPGRVKVKA